MLYQIDGGKKYSGVYYYADSKRIREERKNDTLVWADNIPQFAKRYEAQEPNELGRVEPIELDDTELAEVKSLQDSYVDTSAEKLRADVDFLLMTQEG